MSTSIAISNVSRRQQWLLAVLLLAPLVVSIEAGIVGEPPLMFTRRSTTTTNKLNLQVGAVDNKKKKGLLAASSEILLQVRGGAHQSGVRNDGVVPIKKNALLSCFGSSRGGGIIGNKGNAAPKTNNGGGGTATMPEHIFNLVKAIVGVGVLGLPAGIAAFGDAPSAIIPAVFLIALMGALSAVGFSWIAQTCALTGSNSYRQAWARAVSEETSWIPAVSATSKTFVACLAFSMVLADSLTALLPMTDSRTAVLWTTTLTVLTPLCWMKDLKSLAPFSLLGCAGMVYTALAMTLRYLRGSYLGGSPLLDEVPAELHPSFGDQGWQSVFSPRSMILVSMLSTAYMCHFNAPKFYLELKDNTIQRFNTVVAASFGISIALTAWISAVGFATFGKACSGLVLNNYATKSDVWMSLSRSAVVVSLIFSYPLAFTGLRDGVLDLMKIPVAERSNDQLNKTTLCLLLVLTLLATKVKDITLVLALGGATLGNLLCYVYPAVMYAKACPSAKIPATALGVTGVVFGMIGATLALQK